MESPNQMKNRFTDRRNLDRLHFTNKREKSEEDFTLLRIFLMV